MDKNKFMKTPTVVDVFGMLYDNPFLKPRQVDYFTNCYARYQKAVGER